MNRAILSFIVLLSATISASSQNIDLENLDAYFEKAAKEWGIPGMSVGIVKDGEIVFSKENVKI